MLLAALLLIAQDPPLERLPEGDSGIAAKHPGDVGIGKHASVLLHDDFEDVSKAEDLSRKGVSP